MKKHLIVSLVFVVLIGVLSFKSAQQYQAQSVYNSVINKIEPDYTVNMIKETYNNEDIIGVLDIAGSEIVITKYNDNSYYLNHNLDKSYNILGTPFLDYRTNIDDQKMIIYGHNSNIYNTPLRVLEKYLDQNFYKKNQIIKFRTDDHTYIYQIFSVGLFTNDYSYYELNPNETKNMDLKNKSIYDTDVSISDNDKVLLLQTCSNDKQNTFIIVSAKKINDIVRGNGNEKYN